MPWLRLRRVSLLPLGQSFNHSYHTFRQVLPSGLHWTLQLLTYFISQIQMVPNPSVLPILLAARALKCSNVVHQAKLHQSGIATAKHLFCTSSRTRRGYISSGAPSVVNTTSYAYMEMGEGLTWSMETITKIKKSTLHWALALLSSLTNFVKIWGSGEIKRKNLGVERISR